jgi:hypothetical protein
MIDVENSSFVAGGEPYVPPPIEIEGLELKPSTVTLCSQTTGDADTKLVLSYTGGRAKVFGVVKDFPAAEVIVVNTSGAQYEQGSGLTLVEFSSGMAVWFTLVAVQHSVSGAIGLVAVPGAIAAVASAVVPTFDEIKEALGLDDRATFGICGDIRFHRSADTTIDVATRRVRRPAYVEDTKKTSFLADQGAPTTMGVRFFGHLTLPLDLAAASAKSAGQMVVDGLTLPYLPYGGYVGAPEYIGGVAGAGVGADLTFLLNIDGTPTTGGGVLQLVLATTAIPAKVSGTAPTGAHKFKSGATLDLELDVKTTVFSGGSGIVRVPVWEYVP